jgi:hypothetical protein
MTDDLKNLVRSEWFAYYRWTAALSTFLIGISLTILAIVHKDIKLYSVILLIGADVILLITVICIRKILRLGLFDVYHKMAFNTISQSKVDEIDATLKNSESFIRWFFWTGFILIILFIFSYWAKHILLYICKNISG